MDDIFSIQSFFLAAKSPLSCSHVLAQPHPHELVETRKNTDIGMLALKMVVLLRDGYKVKAMRRIKKQHNATHCFVF